MKSLLFALVLFNTSIATANSLSTSNLILEASREIRTIHYQTDKMAMDEFKSLGAITAYKIVETEIETSVFLMYAGPADRCMYEYKAVKNKEAVLEEIACTE